MGETKGPVAERLGRGLQNLLHQFKSGRDLQKKDRWKAVLFFYGATVAFYSAQVAFYNASLAFYDSSKAKYDSPVAYYGA